MVLNGVRVNISLNMMATVEVNVWAVINLPALMLTVTSIGDAMTFNFGDLNAHARDDTATSGLVNLLVRPMVGVFPKAIIGVVVEGSIRYNAQVMNGNNLWVMKTLQVRYNLESDPTLGLPRTIQVDICNCKLTFTSI